MSLNDRLSAFSEQVGFVVEVETETIRAVKVPCLLSDGVVGFCTIETSYEPTTGKPDRRIGGDIHAVRITVDNELDGLVYHADGPPIGNQIDGDGKTWSNISIKKGGQGRPEEDGSAFDLLHRYAKQIVGAVTAAGDTEIPALATSSPFKIPNTFEARSGLTPIQDRIRDQRIAIIGLGGTGAYVLDLVAKTPVKEIHILDFDDVKWHNFMRAPGAPTTEEIESKREAGLRKVEYYHSKYLSLREGIQPHAIRVESVTAFLDFVEVNPIDYAFVCVDQLAEGDSSRQDVIYSALAEAGVPFVDSGVSITLKDSSVMGAVTTSAYEAGSVAWKDAVPNARVEGDIPGLS